MSALPQGYSIRAATMDDVGAVAEMLAADDVADTGEVFHDADSVRFLWTKPGTHMPDDTWVMESPDGRVIGHANVNPEGDGLVGSWGVVHPDHRGVGIGSALLDLVERRGAELLPRGGRLQHALTDTDRVAARMLRARGFERVRSYRYMQIGLDGSVEPPQPPPGIEIRGIDPDRDLRAIHSILVEAFRDEFNYRVIPFEEWLEIDVKDEGFDPTLWLLATADGEPVGALSAAVWGDRGWVNEVGVRQPWRGRGIGSAMLRRSFEKFAERGLPRVMLNVDSENPMGAVGVYERAGMRAVRGWEVYEKRLPPG